MSDKGGNGDNKEGANMVVLAVAIVLVALTVFLLLKLKTGIAMENCVAQGRHDCAPVASGQAQ